VTNLCKYILSKILDTIIFNLLQHLAAES